MTADFKPTFICWYENDYQSDRIIRRWTSVQRAFYRNLLMESYYNPLRPNLPSDDSQLWALADADSLEHWLENKDTVLGKFSQDTDSDGNEILWNKRVREEWEKMQGRLEQKKNAGAASARARLLKSKGKKARPVKTQDNTGHKNTVQESTQQHTTSHKSVQRSFNARSTDVQTIDVVDVVHSSSPSSGKAGGSLKTGQIISKFQQMAVDSGVFFNSTSAHRDAAIAFFDSVGEALALITWKCHLDDAEHIIKRNVNGKEILEDKAWVLNDFIESGHAETWVEKVRPYVAMGITDPDTIRFFVKYYDVESTAELELTREEIKTLKNVPLEYEFKKSEDEHDIPEFMARILDRSAKQRELQSVQ